MKKIMSLGFLFSFCLLFIICSNEDELGPNELEGDIDIDLTQVGNTFGTYISIDGESYGSMDTVYISQNNEGIVTVSMQAKVADFPDRDLIPGSMISDSIAIYEAHFKITSDGIQNYYDEDESFERPFTIAKYSGKVGDSWDYTKDNGNKITRTITEKSTEDDFEMGFYLIKTTVTEEDTDIPGMQKIRYRTNHKFGLVQIEYIRESGTTTTVNIIPWAVVKHNSNNID